MNKFALTALLAASLAAPAFAAESIQASVNGMVCAFCAQGIEKRLSKMPAAKAVFVDLKQRIVAVEARDGQKLDDQRIRAEITDAGYDVTALQTVPRSVAEIRTEAKSRK